MVTIPRWDKKYLTGALRWLYQLSIQLLMSAQVLISGRKFRPQCGAYLKKKKYLNVSIQADKQHDSDTESQTDVISWNSSNELIASTQPAVQTMLRLGQAHPVKCDQSARPSTGTGLGVQSVPYIFPDQALGGDGSTGKISHKETGLATRQDWAFCCFTLTVHNSF